MSKNGSWFTKSTEEKKKKKQQQISPHRIMQTKSEEIALGELWLARARVLWCLFFFFAGCNLNTPSGNRTSWIGQKIKSRAEQRKEGEERRGNEIVARKRTGDGEVKRGKREVREKRWWLKTKVKKRKRKKGTARGSKLAVNECQTGFIKCIIWLLCLEHVMDIAVSIIISKNNPLTSPWKLLSKGATCFRKS